MAKRERIDLVSGVRIITTQDNYIVLDDGPDPLTEGRTPRWWVSDFENFRLTLRTPRSAIQAVVVSSCFSFLGINSL